MNANECLCCSVQVPDLDMLIVPISGGGMISGIAVAAKALKPGIEVIGAEPTGGDTVLAKHQSLGTCPWRH